MKIFFNRIDKIQITLQIMLRNSTMGLLTEKTILPVCRLVLNQHLVQGQDGLLQDALDAVGKHLLLWRSQQGEPPAARRQ